MAEYASIIYSNRGGQPATGQRAHMGTQRPQEKFSHAQQNASEAQIFHQHCSFASALLSFLSPTLALSLRAQ